MLANKKIISVFKFAPGDIGGCWVDDSRLLLTLYLAKVTKALSSRI